MRGAAAWAGAGALAAALAAGGFGVEGAGGREEREGGEALLRPEARVEEDPAAYYSPALYREMGPARAGDWRTAHPESARSFYEYRRSGPNRPTRGRHWVVLQPLGTLTPRARGLMRTLEEFLGVYYALPVRSLAAVPMARVTTRERTMFGRPVRQYMTLDIMNRVLRPRVARGTFCLLGVTMDDLYPAEEWNYVFGQAALAERVGVYSLVRFFPEFWGEAETEASERLGRVRSLRTMVHETGHMFGVRHCQRYECVMNGSNSLAESDGRPMHLCPECLKKFRWNIGFDVVERYEELERFYREHGMGAEAAWVAKRLAECRGEKAGAKGGTEDEGAGGGAEGEGAEGAATHE